MKELSEFSFGLGFPYRAFETSFITHYKPLGTSSLNASCDFGLLFWIPCKAKLSVAVSFKAEPTGGRTSRSTSKENAAPVSIDLQSDYLGSCYQAFKTLHLSRLASLQLLKCGSTSSLNESAEVLVCIGFIQGRGYFTWLKLHFKIMRVKGPIPFETSFLHQVQQVEHVHHASTITLGRTVNAFFLEIHHTQFQERRNYAHIVLEYRTLQHNVLVGILQVIVQHSDSRFKLQVLSFNPNTPISHFVIVVEFRGASGISAHRKNIEYTTYRVPASGLSSRNNRRRPTPRLTCKYRVQFQSPAVVVRTPRSPAALKPPCMLEDSRQSRMDSRKKPSVANLQPVHLDFAFRGGGDLLNSNLHNHLF
ncbi:hypothetical protein C8R43DRAFT_1130050 [Mycena crocata]|nr:hypothetical protein C8R43DRAFT_1130050 [Mycena crocata]